MKIKYLVFAVAMAIGTSATFAQDCTGALPCPTEQSPEMGKKTDLFQDAKGFLSKAFGTVSKGTASLADSLKDKRRVWPDAAQSSSVQLFPSYTNSLTCYHYDVVSRGEPKDDAGRMCANVDKKLRGAYYYITFALGDQPTLDGTDESTTNPRPAFEGRVVAMPHFQSDVTCWKSDVEGNGPKECQILRPFLKDLLASDSANAFKYAVVPNAVRQQELIKLNSSSKTK